MIQGRTNRAQSDTGFGFFSLVPVGRSAAYARAAHPEVHAYSLSKQLSRLDYLNGYREGREFLLDHFSAADAYLVTVINWTMATPPVDLAKWPAIKTYFDRLRQRPSVAKAIAEEFDLYKAELARHKAAA